MSRPYTFPMGAWINFANTVAEASLERMQEMTEAIQNRRYQPSDWITDSLGFWVDGMNGWWSAMQQNATGPVPFAFIRMAADEESATTELYARKFSESGVRWTDLVRLGDGKTNEPLTIEVRWDQNKPACLLVDAKGLTHKDIAAGKALTAGLYQSSIIIDDKLVGIVQILVEPAQERRARKR